MSTKLPNPPNDNAYYDNTNNYFRPGPEQYFVVGTNYAGRHGKGGALTALKFYGAKYGVAEGLQGRTYGIPTKDFKIQPLPLDVIAKHIAKFVEHTQSLEHYYFVTAVGTGLAGYKHSEIAPLFKGVKNCWLPKVWQKYIENHDILHYF